MDSNGEVNRYFLQPGFVYCTTVPTAIETILGSCVSLCLFDRVRFFGGMNHYIYPAARSLQTATAQYGNAAIIRLYKCLLELGAEKDKLVAKILGGAYIRNNEDSKLISRHNVEICYKILRKLNIKIISEDTGGIEGRKVIFFNHTNRVFVKKISKPKIVPDLFIDSQNF
jgi:chemotaxis protein CheD